MFPLFLLLFGLGDFSKVAVAAFAGWLVVVFNVAYGVMNARKTRMLAAKSIEPPAPVSSLTLFSLRRCLKPSWVFVPVYP